MVKRLHISGLDCAWEEIPLLHSDCVDEIEEKIILEKREVVDLFEAAQLLCLHVDTIKKAIINGKLKAFRLESGEWQFSLEEILQVRKDRR